MVNGLYYVTFLFFDTMHGRSNLILGSTILALIQGRLMHCLLRNPGKSLSPANLTLCFLGSYSFSRTVSSLTSLQKQAVCAPRRKKSINQRTEGLPFGTNFHYLITVNVTLRGQYALFTFVCPSIY